MMRIVIEDGRAFELKEEFANHVRNENLTYEQVQGMVHYIVKYHNNKEAFDLVSENHDDELTYETLEELYQYIKEAH